MKKFVIFALAVLIAFAMCSCQPTTEGLTDGLVEFKINLGQNYASKSLTATGEALDAIKYVDIALMPSEQESGRIRCEYSYTDATSGETVKESEGKYFTTLSSGEVPETAWLKGEDGFTSWDSTNSVATMEANLYLSQGKWTIYARATTEEGIVYYEGSATTFVNKTSASCTIIMTPKETTGTGTLIFDALEGDKVMEDIEDEQITYKVVSLIDGTTVTGTLEATESSSDNYHVVFDGGDTEKTLTQGYYLLLAQLEQYDEENSKWVTQTGGAPVDFDIYEGKKTTITGSIDVTDYLKMAVGAKIEQAEFTIAVAVDTDGVTKNGENDYDVAVTATLGKKDNTSNSEIATITWIADGVIKATDTVTDQEEATYTFEGLSLGYHNITAIVTGYIDGENKAKINARSKLAEIITVDTGEYFED